jgi:hypothetical protein
MLIDDMLRADKTVHPRAGDLVHDLVEGFGGLEKVTGDGDGDIVFAD